ncbi:MAG: glycoside hydrolase family 38 C-terminal domain-containing protein, partial [Kiritimatiellales bacterium]
MKKRPIYYILSSHWDREWYQPFQDYRYRLVRLLDKTLHAMESGELSGPFCADGQAILAEDYLEIRPEKRAEFNRRVQAGDVQLGPWYLQPDEFLVSGESLIRNLRLGREVARAHGGAPSNVGFICDQFGHNSQLPQIFKGFGIHSAMLWRGVNLYDNRHFIWEGADGSELVAYRWGGEGYGDFCLRVREAKQNKPYDEAEKRELLKKYIAHEANCTGVDALLLFDGGDHLEFDPQVYALVREKIEAGEVEHVDLDCYMAAVLTQRDRITERRAGELREPSREKEGCVDTAELIPGVLSSRVWIKQRNANCETLLTRWAEPYSLFAAQSTGAEYPQGFLNVAWKWLLKNHPHDSICGCSIDRVHEDMKFRFSQCEQIGERLTLEATARLAANIKGEIGEKELRVAVFNPDVQPFNGTVELALQIPVDWPNFAEFFGYELKPSFRIFGPDGKEIAYQRLGQSPDQVNTRISPVLFPVKWKSTAVRVSLPLEIPACGYAALKVHAGEVCQNQGARRAERTRHAEHKGLAVAANAMQNHNLRVEVQSNGTLKLTDRRTGEVYEHLMTVEDTADIGDGWYHGMAVNDQTFVSTACAADIALVHNGPYLTTFRIRTVMRVPAAFDFKAMSRAESFSEMVVDSLVSLRPESESIEVQTRIVNPAKDHRVRMLFPSGCVAAQTYLADSPFDVVERAIGLRADRHLYKELEVETKPQQSWTAVQVGQRGLAVISKGLLESAVRDTEDRAIALTLFRSTGRTVLTCGEPEGQMLNQGLVFDYRIRPLPGEPVRVALCREGQRLAAGLRHVQLQSADLAIGRNENKLLPLAGFMQVDGDAIVTATQWTEKGMELRLFNPEITAVEVQ